MIWLTAYISLALAIFNIIPVSPLDGSKVLFALLPDAAYAKLMRYERYGMILLLVLVATGVLGKPLIPYSCCWEAPREAVSSPLQPRSWSVS